uniref:Uncharacterized protein n=1 Tax=Zea mays TaxID=4577 RepID=B6U3M4_MAIZE|nr:hypothetical protein [Zea mays]
MSGSRQPLSGILASDRAARTHPKFMPRISSSIAATMSFSSVATEVQSQLASAMVSGDETTNSEEAHGPQATRPPADQRISSVRWAFCDGLDV